MSTTASTSAAESLLGRTLVGGWVVIRRLERAPGATGGTFSVSYIAECDGKQAFVKALDYQKAFEKGESTPEILQYMTASFNFEKAVLDACAAKRMRRVALPIASGSLEVAEAAPISRVDYLILEVADRDVRTHLDSLAEFDPAWCVRFLHQAAAALIQLHAELIAHQDVKPSNFLVFDGRESKITDFGRSARQGYVSPHDHMICAGDLGYSSPELLYEFVVPDWRRRRLGNDIYMLGSLAFFLFTGVSTSSALISFLHPDHVPENWGGDYSGVLPYLRDAFDRVMIEFTECAEGAVSKKLAADLAAIVRELCDPDPFLRGDPKNRGTSRPAQGLERYVTRFNVIASRLEMKLASDAPATR